MAAPTTTPGPLASFECEAGEFAGAWWCGRCGGAVAAPAERVCKSIAEAAIGLSVMQEAALAEAERIEQSVRAGVALGEALRREGKNVRPGPDLGLLRRAAVLRATARLVAAIDADAEIKKRLKERK